MQFELRSGKGAILPAESLDAPRSTVRLVELPAHPSGFGSAIWRQGKKITLFRGYLALCLVLESWDGARAGSAVLPASSCEVRP